MSEIATERKAGILTATCLICGKKSSAPDKGIGRANLAAWRTRHQHRTDHEESRP